MPTSSHSMERACYHMPFTSRCMERARYHMLTSSYCMERARYHMPTTFRSTEPARYHVRSTSGLVWNTFLHHSCLYTTLSTFHAPLFTQYPTSSIPEFPAEHSRFNALSAAAWSALATTCPPHPTAWSVPATIYPLLFAA